MDQTDYEIIKILCKDARTPFKRIAKTLGIGTDTVFRRFTKLQKEGLVLGSTVILSSQACGIKGLFGLFIKLKSGSSVPLVRDKICEMSPLIVPYPEWGEYDFYVDVFFTDHEQLADLIDNLRKIKEIVALDPINYQLQEWSLPFVLNFESEVPAWAFKIQKKRL